MITGATCDGCGIPCEPGHPDFGDYCTRCDLLNDIKWEERQLEQCLEHYKLRIAEPTAKLEKLRLQLAALDKK